MKNKNLFPDPKYLQYNLHVIAFASSSIYSLLSLLSFFCSTTKGFAVYYTLVLSVARSFI